MIEMGFSRKFCHEHFETVIILPSSCSSTGLGKVLEKYVSDMPLGFHFCDFISLDFDSILLDLKTKIEEFHNDNKTIKKRDKLNNKLKKLEKTYIKITSELIHRSIFFNEFTWCIEGLLHFYSEKSYYESSLVDAFKLIKSIKNYIDKSIENSFFSQYDVFLLACDMEYFTNVDSLPVCNRNINLDLMSVSNNTFNDIITLYQTINAENSVGITYTYTAPNYASTLIAQLHEIFSNGYTIKKCLNCDKYFIPYNRTDTFYCDRSSPQDDTKTCKEYGARQAYQANLKNDEAKGLYRKIYMAKQMQAKRNIDIPMYKENFEHFKNCSKEWKERIKTGSATKQEYIEWLKSVKCKKEGDTNGNHNET